MATIRITSEHVRILPDNTPGPAVCEYIGDADLTNVDGSIIIEKRLGNVRFPGALRARDSIIALDGSGIIAASIEADMRLSSGFDIYSDGDIVAREGITAPGIVQAAGSIRSGGDITSERDSIEAGGDILCGGSVVAGWAITAAGRLRSGKSIRAGIYIHAREISADLRIFAGMSLDQIPTDEQCEIRGALAAGDIAHGVHIEPTGEVLPPNYSGE